MGCWNGTCMISHLPIIAGDKIKLVILHGINIPINNASAYCYSNGLLEPSFLPLTGEYNDTFIIK